MTSTVKKLVAALLAAAALATAGTTGSAFAGPQIIRAVPHLVGGVVGGSGQIGQVPVVQPHFAKELPPLEGPRRIRFGRVHFGYDYDLGNYSSCYYHIVKPWRIVKICPDYD
jgi:hypothetical protein